MLRATLGDYSSIVCFKAAIVGMENALGEKTAAIALISAGRQRGKQLAEKLGLVGKSMSFEALASQIGLALGKDGTSLCIVSAIKQEGNTVKVYTLETLCSAGEPLGSSRQCTYTLGAIWGLLEQVFGKRLQGKHTESVLRGSNYDVFEFTEF
jgi:predicted hydrocarbon binding protein